MIKLNDNSIEILKDRIGMDTATLLVTPDSDKRHFIGEALLTAAILLLVNEFFKGFLEGLEIKGLGKDAGKKLQNNLNNIGAKLKHMLNQGSVNEVDIEEARSELQSVAEILTQIDFHNDVSRTCEQNIVETLIEHGAVDEQAKAAAIEIRRVLYEDAIK